MFLELVKQELGESKGAGGEIRFNCPFCGETDYKFYIQIEEPHLWICFKCSETGNPVSFVMKHFSVSYPESLDILAMYDYEIDKGFKDNLVYDNSLTEEERLLLFITQEGKDNTKVKEVPKKLPPSPTNVKTLTNNFNSTEAFPFFSYLHSRGVSLDQIYKHNISYVTRGTLPLPSGKELTLVNHLVFYTFSKGNKPIYWNTRSIDPNPFIKTFNAPSKDDEHSKNNVVFNLNNAEKTDKIVVTEGVFDAMTIGDSGVATFGKKLTHAQVVLLSESAKKYNIPIYLFLDSDAHRESLDVVGSLGREGVKNLYIVLNKTNKDANSLGRGACDELIQNAIVADEDGRFQFSMEGLF